MSDEIVDYIAQNVKTNIRELEGVNTSLMAEALFNKKRDNSGFGNESRR